MRHSQTLSASGDGAGGGGAGGTVVINGKSAALLLFLPMAQMVETLVTRSLLNVRARWRWGSGIIWVAGSSFPAAITSSVTGGQNGIQSPANSATCGSYVSGATSGANGNAQPNYVLPASATKVCTPLPIPGLQYFSGLLTNSGTVLTWVMNSTENVYAYELQSSENQLSYQTIASIKIREITN